MSSYLALGNLLNAVGSALSPKVFCVGQLAEQGAGHPDFLRLANAMAALYPRSSEEKRLLDAMLLAAPR